MDGRTVTSFRGVGADHKPPASLGVTLNPRQVLYYVTLIPTG